jgi:acyl-CoA thioesterase-1
VRRLHATATGGSVGQPQEQRLDGAQRNSHANRMSRFLSLLFGVILALVSPFALAQASKPEAGGEKKKDPAFAPVIDAPGLPRVLLIGDSISIGYTPAVREALQGVANVHRIPENGGSTCDGLEKLDRWLETDGGGKWDVIHFNFGLHDLKHWKDNKLDLAGPQLTPLDLYEKNLRDLTAKLLKTGAKVIFATTTPVPEGSAGRVGRDELAYNEAARRVMKEFKVPIDDLHTAIAPKLGELQLPKNVHFRPEGSKVLAEQVVGEIAKALKK